MIIRTMYNSGDRGAISILLIKKNWKYMLYYVMKGSLSYKIAGNNFELHKSAEPAEPAKLIFFVL